MGESKTNSLIIKCHDFEKAKKEIKKFSEQAVTGLNLKRVGNSKSVGKFITDVFSLRGFGLDHQVTGEELNELTSQIQRHLHNINGTQIKLIKEFGEIYNALEALDREYIQAILVSIRTTEETSEGIKNTQKEIEKILENQKRTLGILEKFKNKLEDYAHLEDIDKIWQDYQKLHQEINVLSENDKKHTLQILESKEQNKKFIDSIQKDKEEIKKNVVNIAQTTDSSISLLTKKIKYAYWIVICTIGLVATELILLLTGVIQ